MKSTKRPKQGRSVIVRESIRLFRSEHELPLYVTVGDILFYIGKEYVSANGYGMALRYTFIHPVHGLLYKQSNQGHRWWNSLTELKREKL